MTKRGVKVLMKGYYVHESSYIDENVEVGEGTKIWHFCHIQSGAKIGRNCSLGQNVNIANEMIKLQEISGKIGEEETMTKLWRKKLKLR